MYSLKKTLYGLKQVPRAWYERLTHYLLKHDYTRGNEDKTLFVRSKRGHIVVAQIYLDNIVFGSTSTMETKHIVQVMKKDFKTCW